MSTLKLRYSTASPFARKCWIVAIECGLENRLELVPTSPWAADSDLPKDNPLGKIPCLITEGGEALYDSPVICEYLDFHHEGARLIPASGGERWRQLRLQALADGLMEAAVAKRIETAMRPEAARWPDWVKRQDAAITRALDVLEQDCPAWDADFLIGQIAVVSALGYLDFRAVADWRAGRPALSKWADNFAGRPSVASTVPRD